MEFRVLGGAGPAQVCSGDVLAPQPLQPLLAVVLGALLVAQEPVSLADLLAVGWAREPANALNAVETCVTRLRRRLIEAGGTAVLHPRDALDRYALTLRQDRCDLTDFRRERVAAREWGEQGDWSRALPLYRQCLARWQREPLAGLPLPRALAAKVVRLREEYLATTIEFADAVLEIGSGLDDLLPRLSELARQAPDSQPVALRLARSLQTAGRPNEALAALDRIRRRLRQTAGLDAGPAIEALYRELLDPGSPGRAGPAAGPPRAPRGTPYLTGRDVEVARFAGVLAQTRSSDELGGRLLLSGGPGVGKTALAYAVAERVRDRFADGQVFVRLAPGDSARRLLGVLLRRLGISGGLPQDVAERADLLRRLLEGRSYLVIVDDVTGEEQVRPMLELPWAGVMLVSRRWLSALDDVQPHSIAVLAQSDAQELLRRIVPDAAAADPQGLAEVARLCAGLPLALRIAAARLAARDALRPAELAVRLRDANQQSRLDALTAGDLAVRATFLLAYQALNRPARELFRQLGGLARHGLIGVRPYLAAAGMGVPTAEIEVARTELLAAHLVDPGPPGQESRLRLHELLLVFAGERYDAEEPGRGEDMLVGVAVAYLEPALRAERLLTGEGVHPCGRPPAPSRPRPAGAPPDAQVVSWMDADRDQFAAIVAGAGRAGRPDLAATLGRAVMPVLEAGAHWDRWRELLPLARAAAEAGGVPPSRLSGVAAIDAAAGTLLHYEADLEGSRRALDAAVEGYRRADDRSGLGYAQTMRAMTLRSLGLPATGALDEALALARELDDPVLEVEALRCYAWQDRDHSATDVAITRLTRATQRLRDVPRADRLAGYVLHDLGVAQRDHADIDLAGDTLNRALAIFDRLGDRHWAGLTRNQIGQVYLRAGRLAEAADSLTQALDLFAKINDVYSEVTSRRLLARVLAGQGDVEAAEASFDLAAALAHGAGSSRHLALVQVEQAEFLESRGQTEAAAALFSQAWAALAVIGVQPWTERAAAGRARTSGPGMGS